MKIALLGYGKMGKLIETIALSQGHEIILRKTEPGPISNELKNADVAIDFSSKDSVIPHLEQCLNFQIPLVIGTTGWDEKQASARALVEKQRGIALYSPNFSIGVYLFFEIVRRASTLLQPFSQYDVSGIESHHKEKKDSPSGTALLLTSELLKTMPRLPDTFSFQALRQGYVPGTHTLVFDSQVDSIQLTHEAKNRQGFAEGALEAAKWLLSKKSGFYTFSDFVGDQYAL